MYVEIESHWATRGHRVWFYERAPMRVLRLTGDDFISPTWEMSPDGATYEPTLTLPEGALEALLAEAEKVIPASHATERHLLDTNAVRDRLLSLVEKLCDKERAR